MKAVPPSVGCLYWTYPDSGVCSLGGLRGASTKNIADAPTGSRSVWYLITYVVGNLFESPAQVLVNTVNTVGVMGKGIAKEFKSIYPEMFSHYQAMCEAGQFRVGQLWLYKTPHKWILNFPTKQHWRQPSRIDYIELGLRKFVDAYHDKGITSIAFPMLGCGNGELDWEGQVRPLMEKHLKSLPIEIYVYLYRKDAFVPEHRNPKEVKEWLRSEPRSLSFQEVMDDLEELIGLSGLALENGAGIVQYALALDSASSQGLLITSHNRASLVERSQLFDLWNAVRSVGFLTEDAMPPGLEHLTDPFQLLFEKLPYLKRVLVSRNYQQLTHHSVALQLTAPAQAEAPGKKPLMLQVDNAHAQGAETLKA